jgi:SAM-dependent methyltransferase/predicted transcriptional regulator
MRNKFKKIFTNYWEYLALKTACKTNIFDLIEKKCNTIEDLAINGHFDINVLSDLINALEQIGTLKQKDNVIYLTDEGRLFTEKHNSSLKYSCIHWGEEHLTAWQNLEYTLKTGKSAFEYIYKKPLFKYIEDNQDRLKYYHKAMYEYAKDDYKNICEIIDFSKYNSIMDVGGGLGALINYISNVHKNIKCYLFDKSEVVELVENPNFEILKGDFFKEIPAKAEVILMSRVIHDWDNDNANKILQNVYKALPQEGVLFLVENMTNRIKDKASLLSLNMHLITKSFERSEEEYIDLLKKNNFKIEEIVKINDLQYAIKSSKI